jgi:TRAP-type mannitol/chloroaromatic compound transport system permease small subunit
MVVEAWEICLNTTSIAMQDVSHRITQWVVLVGGLYSIVYGLTARTFSFHSRAWKPGEERVEFHPQWKHRLLVALGGVVLVFQSLSPRLDLLKKVSILWHR